VEADAPPGFERSLMLARRAMLVVHRRHASALTFDEIDDRRQPMLASGSRFGLAHPA